ncbi:MAG: energy transducer TonB [Bacteroidetes bacterium]|nr:energy transducer TonB [Bacteroidota bacterium]
MDTTWFNAEWKESTRSDAKFYRIYKKTPKGFIIYDKYLSGQNQMVAEASAVKPKDIKEGYCVYYLENGALDHRGIYKNDEYSGNWIYYHNNGKDSVISVFHNGLFIHDEDFSGTVLEKIYTVTEEMPEFPGGINALFKFIQGNISYPRSCRDNSIGGKVFLKFVVSGSGDISDVTIMKSSGMVLLDNEAVRVVKSMPRWKPGYQDGKAVNVYFNLPLNFTVGEPTFVFNSDKDDAISIKYKSLIEGGNFKDVNRFFEENKTLTDLDFIYNYGVLLFIQKEKKKSCSCFEKVCLSDIPITSTIKSNSYEYMQKYCK